MFIRQMQNLADFSEEVYGMLDFRNDSRLMWKVPAAIRAEDGFPAKDELPVVARTIHHLFCPVWEGAARMHLGESMTVVSYGTQPRISCRVPDLGFDSTPIDIHQLRLATEEDVKNNPNQFGVAPADDYVPGSDSLSAYPESEGFEEPSVDPDPGDVFYK